MRSVITLVLFTLMVVATGFSVEKPDAQAKPDYVRPYIAAPENPEAVKQLAWLRTKQFTSLREQLSKRRLSLADNTCYTMHSLVAEREPQSDETKIVKQRTCTPASQFEMKDADQQRK
jgi:hypothetical protein